MVLLTQSEVIKFLWWSGSILCGIPISTVTTRPALEPPSRLNNPIFGKPNATVMSKVGHNESIDPEFACKPVGISIAAENRSGRLSFSNESFSIIFSAFLTLFLIVIGSIMVSVKRLSVHNILRTELK